MGRLLLFCVPGVKTCKSGIGGFRASSQIGLFFSGAVNRVERIKEKSGKTIFLPRKISENQKSVAGYEKVIILNIFRFFF